MSASATRKAPRVLVVDDDPGLAEVIDLLLSREGYAAERAGTVRGGARRVPGWEAEPVLPDPQLPRGGGGGRGRHGPDTTGRSARGPGKGSAGGKRSLPVPLSPVMGTCASEGPARRTRSATRRIAGLSATSGH